MPALVGVYRRRNLVLTQRIARPALEAGWQVAWWALDATHEALTDITVGEGPGERLPLINRCLAALEPQAWTVLSDDDLELQHGNVVEFIELCQQLGFDLAGPAREYGTHFAHPITRRARFSKARLTTFVECGPMVAVGPKWRDRVLPLPEARGMGWGLEIDWFDLYQEGCRLGIVDMLPAEHVGEPVADYDYRDMNRRMKEELVARGNPKWAGMRETLSVWRPWQKRAPWVRSSTTTAGESAPTPR